MEKMLQQYGTPMVLRRDDTDWNIRAFLQQTRSRGQSHGSRTVSALGEVPGGMFVYIGPAEPETAVGDILVYRDRLFEVRRAEPVTVGETVLYCWGLCVEMGVEGAWES